MDDVINDIDGYTLKFEGCSDDMEWVELSVIELPNLTQENFTWFYNFVLRYHNHDNISFFLEGTTLFNPLEQMKP